MPRSSSLSNQADIRRLKEILSVYQRYVQQLERQPLSPHTVRAYKVRLQHFLGYLGERLCEYEDALTDIHTRDYLARDYKLHLKQALKAGPQTVNGYLTAIDSFYRFVGLGKVKANREELPKLAPQALTAKEQKDFLRAIERCASARDSALAMLLLYTGIRISECAALNIDDILLTERKGLVKIRSGKGGGYREIPLNSLCRAHLDKWLAERRALAIDLLPALFISQRGNRLSVDAIDHAIRKLAESAKISNLSAHTLRHTCLTNLVRNGNDIVLVAQIGGHKKLETTMRYSLPTIYDQQEAMEKIAIEY